MKILAVDYVLPSKKVYNDEVLANIRRESKAHLEEQALERLIEMTQQCFNSTKTQVRYHRDEKESACELGLRAGQQVLQKAQLAPEDIDLLIYVGIGRGFAEPATAYTFQDLLGLRNATCFDIIDACASWLRAIEMAKGLFKAGMYRNIMILNTECVGRDCHRYEIKSLAEFGHWHPSVTIGEAATATILQDSEEEIDIEFRSWGEKRDLCTVPFYNYEEYIGKPAREELVPMQFYSYGFELMTFGARKLIHHFTTSEQFKDYQPDIIFGHSVSDGMSTDILEACGLDTNRYIYCHRLFANTVSASIPLAMAHALENGKLKPNAKILYMIGSAGFTTGLAKFVYK